MLPTVEPFDPRTDPIFERLSPEIDQPVKSRESRGYRQRERRDWRRSFFPVDRAGGRIFPWFLRFIRRPRRRRPGVRGLPARFYCSAFPHWRKAPSLTPAYCSTNGSRLPTGKLVFGILSRLFLLELSRNPYLSTKVCWPIGSMREKERHKSQYTGLKWFPGLIPRLFVGTSWNGNPQPRAGSCD